MGGEWWGLLQWAGEWWGLLQGVSGGDCCSGGGEWWGVLQWGVSGGDCCSGQVSGGECCRGRVSGGECCSGGVSGGECCSGYIRFSLYCRLRRDITERGRDLEGVLKQYNKFVKPVRLVHQTCMASV